MASERGNENSAVKIENHLDDTGSDEAILESSCIADTAIWDESNDRIGCRVLLRWNDYDCIYLLRCYDWGGMFWSGHIGGRRMEFVVDSRCGGTGIGIRELVGRSVG